MGILSFLRGNEVEETRENYSTYIGGLSIGKKNVGIQEVLAEKLSSVIACTNLISSSIAKLPINLLNNQGIPIENDYRVKMLNTECSEYMLSSQLIENLVKDYLLYGNAFALKSRDGNRITGLTYVNPNNIQVNIGFVGNTPKATYDITLYNKSFSVDVDELLVFCRSSEDGLVGKGILHNGSSVILQGLNEQEKSNEFFVNGANILGVLKAQGKLSEQSLTRLRESWGKLFSGMGNGSKTVILEEGLEYSPISLNPETLQLLNSKNFTVAEICRLFNVPESLVNSNVKSSYSSLEQQNLHFLHYSISPIINKLEKTLDKCLLLESEKGSLRFEIDTDEIQMTSLKERFESHNLAIQNSIKTINEVRKEEGLTPVTNGDYRYIPLSSALIDEKGNIIVPNYIHKGGTENGN